MQKLFACLNVPVMTPKMFKKYEEEVGSSIEKAARESCKRAAEDERSLVLQKAEDLIKHL